MITNKQRRDICRKLRQLCVQHKIGGKRFSTKKIHVSIAKHNIKSVFDELSKI